MLSISFCMDADLFFGCRCYQHEFLKDFFLSTGQLQVSLIFAFVAFLHAFSLLAEYRMRGQYGSVC